MATSTTPLIGQWYHYPVGTEVSNEDWQAPYDEEDEKLSAGPRYSDEEE